MYKYYLNYTIHFYTQYNGYRIKNRDYTECEIKLKNFLDNERDLMINRLKAKTKHSQEHTRNLKILEKFR